MLAVALVVPFVVCAVLYFFRDSVVNTNAALVLVLVVVAVAATGYRAAGIIAALSCGMWFDFFLSPPYHRFAITDRTDIETTVLLLLVGVAVTEIALWGRRQQAGSSRRDGYLAGIVEAANTVATGSATPSALIEHVERQIVTILDIDDCRFDSGTGARHPRLNNDGSVSRQDHVINVDRDGLPTDDRIELLIENGGSVHGRFLLTASTRIARPDLDQRLVAVTLAGQVGAALAATTGTTT
ncbi:protein of unknown function [Sanguibacter gelidistatuariae]|uniref:Sensor protein KdpD transmembrane domain-containing protein n=1 Tax=Sanguibacter gelidistatuariae TaxID=1814289 RepID=A0A1G6GPH8_9MICO|nr:protein of unknown function [Sanguibacter gelidistatuariae]